MEEGAMTFYDAYKYVLVEKEGGITTVTLIRPD